MMDSIWSVLLLAGGPQSNSSLPPIEQFVLEDLITEVLSCLNVKTILRFKCVSKSWNTLISDPAYVKKYLNKSSNNPHLILKPPTFKYLMSCVNTIHVHRFLKNRCIIFSRDNCRGGLNSNNCEVVGSCNGLLCFLLSSRNMECYKYSFRLWNPDTGTRYAEFGTCYEYDLCGISLMFTFGCDILTGTYNVLEFHKEQDKDNHGLLKSQVRVPNLDDDCWRNINIFPMIIWNSVVHLCGEVYWLAMQNYFILFMIRHVLLMLINS
ncbi:putative F-box domain-containing protein [Medicago truncatula]|uniref:Putative F-box domain-containing protein n=1 Tax=Medicago truncatula TaxID=3880 RepID=A0A396I9R7_MEDTR|nr:putative F-box domain-containing protein [Medicago truncatula]